MHHAQQLESVRQIVRDTLRTHGVEVEEAFLENILIREGYYCGRCFSCDGFRAVWFIEEREVKFYAPDGRFLCACSTEVRSDDQPRRRVA
jgi:hypothetical protein